MPGKQPSVSIIIPVYNAAEFIAEALNSVFAQTFADFEVIIVNDGSPDTGALEAAIRPYRHRILYLKQENRGPGAARNHAIAHAQAEFLGFLDGDDSWLPDYLSKQMEFFERKPAPDVVSSDMVTFGDAAVHPTTLTRLSVTETLVTLDQLLSFDFVLLPSSTVVRKQAILKAGGFDETIKRGEDWELWMRIAHNSGAILAHKNILSRRRVHAGGLTRAAGETLRDEARVLFKISQLPQLSPKTRDLLDQRITQVSAYLNFEDGKRLLRSGKTREARLAFQNAYTFFSGRGLHELPMSIGRVTISGRQRFVRKMKLRLLLLGLWMAPRATAFAVTTRAP
jgi:glycosyltransferase involved in cell wall biosynthesis